MGRPRRQRHVPMLKTTELSKVHAMAFEISATVSKAVNEATEGIFSESDSREHKGNRRSLNALNSMTRVDVNVDNIDEWKSSIKDKRDTEAGKLLVKLLHSENKSAKDLNTGLQLLLHKLDLESTRARSRTDALFNEGGGEEAEIFRAQIALLFQYRLTRAKQLHQAMGRLSEVNGSLLACATLIAGFAFSNLGALSHSDVLSALSRRTSKELLSLANSTLNELAVLQLLGDSEHEWATVLTELYAVCSIGVVVLCLMFVLLKCRMQDDVRTWMDHNRAIEGLPDNYFSGEIVKAEEAGSERNLDVSAAFTHALVIAERRMVSTWISKRVWGVLNLTQKEFDLSVKEYLVLRQQSKVAGVLFRFGIFLFIVAIAVFLFVKYSFTVFLYSLVWLLPFTLYATTVIEDMCVLMMMSMNVKYWMVGVYETFYTGSVAASFVHDDLVHTWKSRHGGVPVFPELREEKNDESLLKFIEKEFKSKTDFMELLTQKGRHLITSKTAVGTEEQSENAVESSEDKKVLV